MNNSQRYIVIVKCDRLAGRPTRKSVEVVAFGKIAARQIVMAAEGCPARSIISIRLKTY